jgi:hypothetical protein
MNVGTLARGALVLFSAAFLLGGCYAYGGPMVDAHARPISSLHIPEGHMPPPGMCRIWYPGQPPGQQPPPGDCYNLRHHVPPGAVLIRG